MTVEDPKRQNEAPQEVYDRIRTYVETQPFGSAEYQAISEYIELQTLYETSRSENKWILSPRDESHKLSMERRARVTDFQIALLDHQISQSQSRVAGYGKAYSKIESFFNEDLLDAARRDAAIRFPGQKEEQERFVSKQYSAIYNDIENAVLEKRG